MPVIQRLAAASARGFGLGVGGVGYSAIIAEVASGSDSISSTANSTYQTAIAETATGSDVIVGDSFNIRAVFAGGINSSLTYVSTIDYIQVATTGNATSFGSLSTTRATTAPASSSTRGIYAGGFVSGGGRYSSILYITIATTGNSSTFGTLYTGGIANMGGCSNETIGVFCGGDQSSPARISTLQSVTIASTGNSTFFGDATVAIEGVAGCQSPTIALISGGQTGSTTYTTSIETFTFASGGTATTFGSLAQSAAITTAAACSSNTRGVVAGGRTGTGSSVTNIATMQYVTITSAGNTLYFGDLTASSSLGGGTSSPTRGVIARGYGAGAITNNINYITIASTGNGTTFGNLTVSRQDVEAVSNGHGGL